MEFKEMNIYNVDFKRCILDINYNTDAIDGSTKIFISQNRHFLSTSRAKLKTG
jgi:hypothetical protein